MRVLVLTKKFPYPLREGEPIAVSYLAQGLKASGARLSLLAMNTTKHFFDLDELPADYDCFDDIRAVTVDNRISASGALWHLLTGRPYILSRFRNAAFEEALRHLLTGHRFDVIQLETPYLAVYLPLIRSLTSAPVVMRAHNVEHEIWDRVARLSTGLRRWYLLNQNEYLRHFEVRMLNQYDLLLAITHRDLQRFRELGFEGRAVVAPVGLPLRDYKPLEQPAETAIGFIGALDWMPNQHGITWFLDEVWPEVHRRFPGLVLRIAGKHTPAWLYKRAGGGVEVLGEVADARAFMNRHQVLLAPLFSGSGIKIKVLEGMALRRVVLTTSLGLEGIPAENGREVLVADNPAGFVEHISRCVEEPKTVEKIGVAARQFVEAHFDLETIGRQVFEAYSSILREKMVG